MRKLVQLIAAIAVLLSPTVYAQAIDKSAAVEAVAQPSDYNGIWQEQNHPERYYSIRVKDNTMVLIDLAGLETSGNTLQSAYSGTLTPAVDGGIGFKVSLMAFSKNEDSHDLLLFLESDHKAFVTVGCKKGFACLAEVLSISKIF